MLKQPRGLTLRAAQERGNKKQHNLLDSWLKRGCDRSQLLRIGKAAQPADVQHA